MDAFSCGSTTATLAVSIGRRFDDVDAAQKQLHKMLQCLEAKMDTLSETVCARIARVAVAGEADMVRTVSAGLEAKLDTLSETICARIASATSAGETTMARSVSAGKNCSGKGKDLLAVSRCATWPHSQEDAHEPQTLNLSEASSGAGGQPGNESRLFSRRSSLASLGTAGKSVTSVDMREEYGKRHQLRSPRRCLSHSSVSSSLARLRSRQALGGAGSNDALSSDDSGVWNWVAWNPDSKSRTIFEAISIIMLLVDAFGMPYRLAWDVGEEGIHSLSIWMTRIFWTLDVVLNLCTGFRDKDARLELKLSLAMKNYLRTWFLPDMALVTCDWMTAWTLRDSRWVVQGMRVMRLVRGGRQVVRVWTLVQKARLMIQMKAFHLVMDIALLLLVILWVNHVVCCGWYSVGRYINSDTGSTWLSHEEYSAAGVRYEYWTALHWAITQMTPGSMEVFPESSEERVYSVSTLFLGMLMGSSLVATLTSMLTQYKLRIEASSRKFMQLHQFLSQQGVDPQLALAIKLQVKARSSERQRLQAKDVEYLSLVSNSLREALWHSWCMKHLSGHAFLNSFNLLDSFAVQVLCHNAIKALDFPAGDLIFEEGAPGDCMYFLVNGQMRYNPGEFAPEVNLHELDPKLTLDPGSWCSEPALWTVWTHLGTLEASSTSELLSIEGNKLLLALERFPSAAAVLVDYCATFHRYINESGVLRSDLAYGFDINELVSGLNTETRIKLANPVIHSLQVHFWDKVVNQRCIELLKDEVANGKCDMGFVGAEPVRNTFVVNLCLREHLHCKGRFLVKMGEVHRDGGKVVSSCLLPGVKRRQREAYTSAVERLLGHELGDIASLVETHFEEGFEQTVVMSPSPTYGIRTRYLRTTFQAVLAPGAKLSTVRAPENLQPPAQPSSFKKLFRPDVARASEVEQQTAAVLAAHTSVVVVHCDDTNRASKKLYLWLEREEFEALSLEMAKPVIEQWVASLEFEHEDPTVLTQEQIPVVLEDEQDPVVVEDEQGPGVVEGEEDPAVTCQIPDDTSVWRI